MAGAVLVAGLSTSVALTSHSASAAGIAVDTSVTTHQGVPATSIASPSLSTHYTNELLLAFVASDGPAAAASQSFSGVTGGGLTWVPRVRSNGEAGTAEIWQAVAPTTLSGVVVTATRSSGAYGGSMTVVALSGASTIANGAVGSASAASGAPSAALTTTQAGSWSWGIGNDWDNATTRTVGANQNKFDEYLAPVGDTYWVQRQNNPTANVNTPVTINDTAPTGDRSDLAIIEIPPAVPDTAPPTVPSNVTASVVNSNQVNVSWSASTDDVSVAGYYVFRNGVNIATTTALTYSDTSVLPSTPYTYAVEAFDVGGLVSGLSTGFTVTTPSPSAPVITNVQATAITPNSAVIDWTTDLPSTSLVNYGLAGYTSSTTLDSTLVTAHSQTLSGLVPSTSYHFDVVSTSGSNVTATSADNSFTTLSQNITLPDLQIEVPTSLISISTSNGQRQLQFTHITWDSGTGPFEMDPTYNASTGTATFTQAIYSSSNPGVWSFAYRVPISAVGVYVGSEQHYQFPLTRFTLNSVNPDGSAGAVVATSPKTDYCITADAYVGGVPNTPNTTFIPGNNCANPSLPLGWSVGWGDQYDQTDSGQPISLAGVPDGTYILQGTVDPQHVFTESNTTNNVTNTLLQISGNNVTVLSQSLPGTTPPTVAVTSPANGSNVSGTVALQATASAAAPATVTSVQFLLDGLPLGGAISTAPYTYNWTVGSTALGTHTISARATDSNGNVATAPGVSVTVVASAPPPDTTPPTVAIINPVANQTVSGTIPVSANASDDTAVTSVQFFVNGQALGSPVLTSPYATSWNTTAVANGSYTLTALATDTANLTTTSSLVTVTVQNPAPPMTCFVLQAQVTVHGSASATTAAFHTAMAGEFLVAFVSADGPPNAAQSATVSGAGLTWTLVKRANSLPGDAEVWEAPAPSVLASATVKSTLSRSGFKQDLTVIAMEDVSGIGAVVAGSATTGAPSLSLTTKGATSLVFAVGHDWSNAIARTLPAGWVSLEQWTDSSSGDTYWSQYTNRPTGSAGSVVQVGDSAPTNDQWNMVGVELLNAG
jgi:hypothetical protein